MARVHASADALPAGESRPPWTAARCCGDCPRLAEVADATLLLLASNRASAMTAAIANVTCGALIDL
jgi:hypothetical protein